MSSFRVKKDRERLQRQDQIWHLGNLSLEGGRPANERGEWRESPGRAELGSFPRTSQVVLAGVTLPGFRADIVTDDGNATGWLALIRSPHFLLPSVPVLFSLAPQLS